MIAGLVGVIVLSIPQFMVLGTGSVVLIWLMMLAMRLVMSALYGPIASILVEGFAPHVRYTGISLSYQICNMIFGGLAPLAAVSLAAAAGGHYWPPAVMLMAISAVGIVCTARLRRLAVQPAAVQDRTPARQAVPTAP